MPRNSSRKALLEKIDTFALEIAERCAKIMDQYDPEDVSDTEESEVEDNIPIIIDPLSPISPILPILPISPIMSSMSDNESDLSEDTIAVLRQEEARYRRLLGAISALRDEVLKARVLQCIPVPVMQASQLPLLVHFADFRPHLFCKKLRVDPDVFDCILDQIGGHPIFVSRGNQPQLPVAVQLAIFLNRAGHYGNAISPEDVAQWAGVSVGSVINCTHHVMVAVLDQHNQFLNVPGEESEDAEMARQWVEEGSCPGWRNGIFVADGSAINLFEKPGVYGEMFYDRKSRYSLNCQVRGCTSL